MSKVAVIYKSKYGATKQYAEWIARALNADIFSASNVKISRLKDYDMIIFGGGMYAGNINGISQVARYPAKPLVIFTVGLGDPDGISFAGILQKSLPPAKFDTAKTFHLRGALDFDALNFLHRRVMNMLAKALAKKDKSQLNSEEAAVAPIVEYVSSFLYSKI